MRLKMLVLSLQHNNFVGKNENYKCTMLLLKPDKLNQETYLNVYTFSSKLIIVINIIFDYVSSIN